jgi:ribonuclease HI
MVKINFDGAFSKEAQSGGWGSIGRVAAGEPVFAVAGRVNAASEALQSELLALVNVIPVAENLGIGRVVFSTDCLVLKQAMETNSYDLSRLGPLFLHAKFLLSMSFVQFSFEYVSRLCNKPAHELAALGASGALDSCELWLENFPPIVISLVADDLVRT